MNKYKNYLDNPEYEFVSYDSDKFPNGGMISTDQPNANAEVELSEVMRYPNGHTIQADSPSHENGGLKVNLPSGSQIFSDRLKMPGLKKTFAKLAEKFKTGKEEKVLSDPKADTTAKTTAKLIAQVKQAKLDQLFQAQESLKQSKVQAYAKRLGIDVNQDQPQMRNGGTIPKYYWGGTDGKTWIPDVVEDPEFKTSGGVATPEGNLQINQNLGYRKPISTVQKQDYTQYIEPTVNTLLQNSGNIADLAMTNFGRKYDKENYGQIDPRFVKPQYISGRESLRDADVNSSITRGSIKDATGGNAASFLSNQIMNSTNNTMNKAKIREQYENMNTGIYNQADQMNTSIKNDNLWRNKELSMKERSDTQQNKARSEDIARSAIRGLGTNTSAAYRDYKSGTMDKNTANMIGSMFSQYKLDMSNPQHWDWVFKQVNKSK